MKLRSVLTGAVGAVGVTAAANRLLSARATAFEPFLDGDTGTYRWRGMDIAYTELGDPEDDDLLLFHGVNAAASNHEYYRVVTQLAENYHVIIPDMPGYGHSDRPPLLYSASLYEAFIGDATVDLTDDAIVVASSLTASYAAAAATETDIRRLILICPTDTSMGGRKVWLRGLLRSPVVGEGLFNLIASKASIRYFNRDHGYYNPDNMADRVVEYEWQTAHQPNARFAPASFISGFLDPETSLEERLSAVDAPITFVWGRDAETTPLSKGRTLAERVDAGLIVFDRARLLPHMEHPDQFVDVVAGELETTQ